MLLNKPLEKGVVHKTEGDVLKYILGCFHTTDY